MFRLIGYFGGIILFLVLGIQKVPGFLYFFICSILNLVAMGLIIIFRLLAQCFHGFWRVWSKRFQRWISEALMCLGHYTELPQYQITTVTINQGGEKTTATQRTNNTLVWGLAQMAICALLTAIAPLVVSFVLFCYAQSTFYECQFQKIMKQKNHEKEEGIARCSARITLEVPLNDYKIPQKDFSTFRNSLAQNYPYMQPAIVKKPSRNSVNQSQLANIDPRSYQMQRKIQDLQQKQVKKQLSELKEDLEATSPTNNKTAKIEKIQEVHESQEESSKVSVFKSQKMQTKAQSIQFQSPKIRQDLKMPSDQL